MSYSSTSFDPRKFLRLRGTLFLLIVSLFCALGRSVSAAPGTDKDNAPSSIVLEPIDGKTDTVKFHIGSPLFLRLSIAGDRACEPFNGRPFFFDASGAQVGWGFVEIADSLLFPRTSKGCERYLMLSSENSNLLAEGYYTLSVALLLDEKSELRSDTIVLHPVHSHGADALSYSRFILEQILLNSPLLQDPLTLNELFAQHLPHSPTSEVYHAAILYLSGDMYRAAELLKAADDMSRKEGMAISPTALQVSEELGRRIARSSN